MMNLDDSLRNAQSSIFRFEGLQDYTAMDGEEFVQEFLKTGQTSFASGNEWWQMIKAKNDAGIHTCRVRLVTIPITDYTKAEIAYLLKAAEFSGEEIRVITDEQFGALVGHTVPDHYFVDDQYCFALKYGPRGKYLSAEILSAEKAAALRDIDWKLMQASVPIQRFTY